MRGPRGGLFVLLPNGTKKYLPATALDGNAAVSRAPAGNRAAVSRAPAGNRATGNRAATNDAANVARRARNAKERCVEIPAGKWAGGTARGAPPFHAKPCAGTIKTGLDGRTWESKPHGASWRWTVVKTPPPPRPRANPRNVAFTTALAASKFKRSVFTDPITLDVHPRRDGIELNKQMYLKKSIKNLVESGNRRVPHSRRGLTQEELESVGADIRPPQTLRPPPRGDGVPLWAGNPYWPIPTHEEIARMRRIPDGLRAILMRDADQVEQMIADARAQHRAYFRGTGSSYRAIGGRMVNLSG